MIKKMTKYNTYNAYLSHLRTGIKQDTLTALRTAPLHLSTLFPDATIKRAEEDVAQFESKGQSTSGHGKGRSGGNYSPTQIE